MKRPVMVTATVIGLVLVLAGVLSLLFHVVGNGLVFIYLIAGAAGVVCGVWSTVHAARMYLRIAGMLFVILALLGVVGIQTMLGLTASLSVFHILIGAVSLFVGASRS